MLAKRAVRFAGAIGRDFTQLLSREVAFRRAVPRSALLFLTFRCTSRCRSCSMWMRTASSDRELDSDGWLRIADELAENRVRTVELFGGDIFLRKKVVGALIPHLKDLDMTIHIPTNALKMDPEMAELFVRYEVDHLYISLDSVGSEHDKIRGVKGTFHSVVEAVNNIKRMRGQACKPTLICNTTVSNLNVEHLYDIAEFAHKAGFDVFALEYVGEISEKHILNSRIDGVPPDPYFFQRGNSLLLNRSQANFLKQAIPKLLRKYSGTGMTFYTLNVDTLSTGNMVNGTVPMKRCYEERSEVTVDPYGNVIVCPFYSKYVLGNLLERPLKGIWNCPKHLKFRRVQNSGALEICRHCIMMVERCYGIRKGLERIYYKRLREKLI